MKEMEVFKQINPSSCLNGANLTVKAVCLTELTTKSSLEALSQMPPVAGNELTLLLGSFQESLQSVSEDEAKLDLMYQELQEINPLFSPTVYSTDLKANILANVVAAYYAPLIHGFSAMTLKNIEAGNLPPVIIAPPRDTIPIVTSLKAMAKLMEIQVSIIQPPITRKTAGVHNNQNGETVLQDPLFNEMLKQMFAGIETVTELEFGIYSTTSLITAKALRENGLKQFVPLKFYGLGPNLSWVHALLSGGNEWIAEKAEINGLVDCNEIAGLMTLLDSIEEFGMQNMYQTILHLTVNAYDRVIPVIEPVDKNILNIALATNKAVAETIALYQQISPDKIIELLKIVPRMVKLAKEGYPVMLSRPIPPMNSYDEHFQQIKTSQVFSYPTLLT